MKVIENIFYTEQKSELQSLDIYLPDASSFPVLVYFHGGGIVKGDKTERKAFLEEVAKNGIAIVSANYRLYPNAEFPEYIQDAASAFKWVKEHIGEYGTPEGFFIGGSSAGGYISQMLCFDKRYLALHGTDSDSVNGYIMNAGQPTTHFNVLFERGINSKRVVIDDAAPLYYVTENRTYAPMQIFIAENDIRGRLEQTRLLISALENLECDMDKIDYRYMENFGHCKYVDYIDKDGKCPFAEMVCEFIHKYKTKK